MRKSIMGLTAALAAATFAGTAHAQMRSPLSVEVRASAAIPTGDFANTGGGIGTGYGIGADAHFALTPQFGVYAGYSYTGFDYDNFDDTLKETGIDAGVRASLGSGAAFTPYLRGGIVYHKLNNQLGNSDSRTGFEVGAGLDYPLGLVLSVTPEVSYTRINQDAAPDLSHVRLGVGLRFKL